MLSELYLRRFIPFFFGVGAVVTGGLLGTISGLSGRLPLQILIWVTASGVSLSVLRGYAEQWRHAHGRREPRTEEADGSAVVVEEISPDSPGRIRYRGSSWQAVAHNETIPPGSTVTILEQKNLTCTVTAGDLRKRRKR